MNIYIKLFLLFALYLGQCLRANAFFSEKNIGDLQIQVGNWLEYPGQVRASDKGATNGFQFAPFFTGAVEYNLKNNFQLIPELGYILKRTSEKIDKNQFMARLDIAYKIYPFLKFRIGSSLMILNISSDGGEEVLPNGNSSETYYRPNEAHTIFNQTLDFGLEYTREHKSIKLQSYTYAWNIESERIASFSLGLTYGIPFQDIL